VFSPDGTYIVLAVREAGTPQLYRRDLSSFEMTPIDGTEDGTAPFFSPDGRWIGFVTPSAVKKVPAGGGVAQLIAAEPEVNSCDWGEDGLIYFTPHRGGRDGLTMLARLSETGGKAEVVAALDTTAGEFEAWLPEILGDGKTVLVTLSGGAVGWQIVAVRPDGSRQPVVENALLARYVRSGHLIYLDLESEAVLAAPFDPAGPRITGPALPLTEEVDFGFCFDVRDDGKLLYVPQPGAGGGEQIVWLDRGGAATPALDMRAAWAQPRVSPDGRRIVLRKVATDCELWIVDLERGSLARVAPGNDNHDPVWSPDGRRVVVRRQNPPVEMIAFTVEGAREVTTLAHGAGTGWPSSWSAGGDLLVYTTAGRTTQSDIWVRAMGESSPPAAFLATKANETQPAISPDGKWIAYVTNETGTPEVFVRPYPDTGVAWQVSTGGGSGPLWSRSGRELYFASGTKMMAAPIATQPVFRIGNPVELFDGGFAAGSRRDYDIAPDGRFIAVGRTGDEGGQQELRMLLNWPEAMRRVGEALR
jgi:serine/threonine-protein kinase